MPAPARARSSADRGSGARAPPPPRGRRPRPARNTAGRSPPGASRTRCRRLRIGSSTTPAVSESGRPSSAAGSCTVRPRPRNAARSVSHSTGPCTPRSSPSTCTAHAGRSLSLALSPMTQEGRAVGEILGLEKQLGERRMREVLGGRREHDLHVACDFEFARAVSLVRQRQPPHLDVVFRRHRDIERGREVAVAPVDRDAIGAAGDQIVVRLVSRSADIRRTTRCRRGRRGCRARRRRCRTSRRPASASPPGRGTGCGPRRCS